MCGLALQTDSNLLILGRVNGLDAYAHNIEEMRKAYPAFVCLNAFQAQFVGMKAGSAAVNGDRSMKKRVLIAVTNRMSAGTGQTG